MTLSRLLTLLLLAILTVVLAGTIGVNVSNSRRFLSEQLETHAQDTATFLGLTISTLDRKGDPKIAASLIDPVFDRGYYQEIRMVDSSGAQVVERVL